MLDRAAAGKSAALNLDLSRLTGTSNSCAFLKTVIADLVFGLGVIGIHLGFGPEGVLELVVGKEGRSQRRRSG